MAKMTVKQLIADLKHMEEDKEVEVCIFVEDTGKRMQNAANPVESVEEFDDKVVIWRAI